MARTTARRSSGTSKTRPAAARRPVAAQPAWRQPIDQIVTLGRSAVEVAQKRGTQALQAAQRRSSALTFKARQAAEERVEAVAVKVVGAFDQVEQATSERVGRTLNRLGMPSQKDIERLTRSVSQLSAQIEKLSDVAVQPTSKAKTAKATRATKSTAGAKPARTVKVAKAATRRVKTAASESAAAAS